MHDFLSLFFLNPALDYQLQARPSPAGILHSESRIMWYHCHAIRFGTAHSPSGRRQSRLPRPTLPAASLIPFPPVPSLYQAAASPLSNPPLLLFSPLLLPFTSQTISSFFIFLHLPSSTSPTALGSPY
ncbi:hypothetical protein TgHK011_007830 [Trichoderma gracile]|nr:hypothetical protein TgHK011_007830 [Trichoderma gracile]